MRLSRLSLFSIAGCLAGVVILLIVAVQSADRMLEQQARVADLLDLHARIGNFSVASDSLLLFGADQGLRRAYSTEAEQLQRRLERLGERYPDARKAAHRIEAMIGAVMAELERPGRRSESPGTGDTGPLQTPTRARIIMNHVAGHGVALDTALDDVLDEHQEVIVGEAIWIGGTLAGAALLFGSLCVIAFGLIHHRVAAPARSLANTLDRIRAGDDNARAEITGNDELSVLAETLNRMLDERRIVDRQLHERNRRLHQYERLIEHSSDRFCIVDSDYRYTLANEAYAALYGRDRATLEGACLRDIFDPEFLEQEALPPINRCLAGEPQSFEAERTYDSIGTRRFLIRYYPLPDAEGTVREVAAVMTDITEQTQLDERARQFHELIEGTEDLCGIADGDYRYVWVNQAYMDRYGLEREEIEGRPLSEVLGTKYFEEAVKPRLDRCLAGEVQHYETEREHPGLGRRKLLVRYYPIEVPGERNFRSGAVITDVTEIREAESALANQAQLLQMAGQAARFGAWSVDLDSARVEWSDVVAEIHGMPHGYSPDIEEGTRFCAPEHQERIRRVFTACAEQGQPYDEELQIIDADGNRVWVRIVGRPVYDDAGRIVRVHGAFQDISEQRHLGDRLRAYRQLIESSEEPFHMVDRSFRFTLVNQAYARRHGLEPGEIEGQAVAAILGRAYFDRELRPIYAQCLAGEPQRAETEFEYPGLGKRYMQERYSPIATPDGEVTHVGVIISDVTEVKLAQQELVRSRDDLAKLLETRKALINSLPAHIAVLDRDGTIIDVNDQWRHFGTANEYSDRDCGVGSNYIEICDRARGDCAEEAAEVAAGLREVLAGRQEMFTLEYPCHSPDAERWFRLMVNRLWPSTTDPASLGAVVMHVNITERKTAEQELGRIAFEDPLTGLLSRNGFTRTLAERLQADGNVTDGLVILLDVHSQRDVNDAHGYDVGDRLLGELGARLHEEAGEDALVARIGGDEFALYLPPDPEHDPGEQVDRLATATRVPFELDGLDVEVSARIGFTQVRDTHSTVESLLREAELALFQHRSSALEPQTDQIAYTRELGDAVHRRIQTTIELREALRREEFELHYQPKVNLADGKLLSAEALIRWHHPERGLQPPGLFIPVAEQSQLIGPIGNWALRAACRQLREWQDAGLDIVRVAVNVSLMQFMIGDFTQLVRDAIEEFDVNPGDISLEITESVFEQESDALLDQLRALHELGVRLSLDDFGTGYSSLLYLQKYPFDEIKIDQGFVFRLLDDHYSHDIVRTVMGLAHALDAEVVAEGIESAAIRDVLLELGCTMGQGYYYSVPLAAEDFRWLLEMRSNLPLEAGANS